MKRLFAFLMAFMLAFCGSALASSTGTGAAYEKAAESMTMYHYITMSSMYGDDECEPYLMTKPLYHPDRLMIEYGTNNDLFQIVMFCDDSETGIVQIHILFKGDIEPYDAYAQLMGLVCVYRSAHIQAGNEAPDVDLVMILVEALEQTDSGTPWESRVVTINDTVDIVAYRNGPTYAYRLDFRFPVTAEYLDASMAYLFSQYE